MATFEWDPVKAVSNSAKHGISFEEAETIFDDAPLIAHDDLHSVNEERFIAIGLSTSGRVLILSHTYRAGRIRLISARSASTRERDLYGESKI